MSGRTPSVTLGAVTRRGDKEIPHCTGMEREGASPDVFANGKPISCHGHHNTKHLFPPKVCAGKCCEHSVGLIASQFSVMANRRPIGRKFDRTCTMVIQGSPDVFIGAVGIPGSSRSKKIRERLSRLRTQKLLDNADKINATIAAYGEIPGVTIASDLDFQNVNEEKGRITGGGRGNITSTYGDDKYGLV
jgi:hypothetical protein|tara:strand:- start:6766 stop:7335 length:570 start_codon:yes stop_codon:yes gene_type:complete